MHSVTIMMNPSDAFSGSEVKIASGKIRDASLTSSAVHYAFLSTSPKWKDFNTHPYVLESRFLQETL
jgi:hypothetical protein